MMSVTDFQSLCYKLESEMVDFTKTTFSGEVAIVEFFDGFDYYNEDVLEEVLELGIPECEFCFLGIRGHNSVYVRPGPVVDGQQLLRAFNDCHENPMLIMPDARVLLALLAMV